MSDNHRPNVLLAPVSVTDRSAEIDQLNDLLERAGKGRPIGRAEAITESLAALPVEADVVDVLETLRLPDNNNLSSLIGQLDLDPELAAGTAPAETSRLRLSAAGCNVGHSDVAWTPVSLPPPRPARPSLDDLPGGRRPLVALLDSGVEDHPWFPSDNPDDPFCIDAAVYGWRPLRPPAALAAGEFGSHRGHGTFVAGLIHQHAPEATVLSMKLMNDAGKLNESSVIAALEWLSREIDNGRLTVDVVCMAFGRSERDGDADEHHRFRVALAGLGRLGVRVVASAGNNGADLPTYPAAFATDPRLPVISVGSGSSLEPDPFSNRGPWVEEWADGSDVVSAMPLTIELRIVPEGYARWSGTSFSAAVHAATLARRLVYKGSPPELPRP